MARPLQTGLNYFPMDVTIDQDDKVALIEADYGIEGFSIIVKLLMKIYSNGYFYHWGEKEQKLFSRKVNIDLEILMGVVEAALRWDLFSQVIFDNYGILTSRGIQKRYFEACGRRKEVPVMREYLLLLGEETSKYTNLKLGSLFPEGDAERVEAEKPSENSEKVLAVYEDYFEKPSKHVKESLEQFLENMEAEVVMEAMKKTKANKKSFAYLNAILKDFKGKGVKTFQDVKTYDQAFKKKKQGYRKKVIRKETMPKWATADYSAEDPLAEEDVRQIEEQLARVRQKN